MAKEEEEDATERDREEDDDADDEAPESEEPAPKRRAAKAKKEEPKEQPAIALAPMAHLAFVIAAAVGVYSFVSVAKEGEMRRRCTPTCILRPNYVGYERKAPSFTLKDIKGHDVSLESYRGKVVVLNFWTKTCGPCMEEMPEIADLARILKPQSDVAVVTVSTDDTAQEAIDTLKSVLRENEPPFSVLMDPDAKIVRGKYGTSLYPETWIIDKDGVIRARFDGAREWSNAAVVELVNQIRIGGYCPVESKNGKLTGPSAGVCEGLSGG
ncbi:MAG: TlpA family protein disulfide reductase [Labilithrix sp.]|nr:TlpA family protein disulfide reductase [Labilithrix sp.]MCW5809986.1 TlpA family protein disulfide reductase [Labilithrix sp.]